MRIQRLCLAFLASLTISWASAQNDQWFVSMIVGTYEEAYNTGEDFPKTFVKEQWAKGQYIVEVTYGDGEWYVTTSAGAGISDQTYKLSETFPGDWVSQKWEEGFDITKVAYGQEQWLVVMSKGLGMSGGTWATRNSMAQIRQYIDTKWNENRDIVSIAYGGGYWAVVLAQGTGFTHQIYMTSDQGYPMQWTRDNFAKGYNVSSVTYGQGYWFVVMSKLPSQVRESFYTSTTFPKEWIQQQWDRNRLRLNTMHYNYEKDMKASFDEYYEAGVEAANQGNHELAIQYYTQALEVRADATVYNNRAWSKYLLGQCQGALPDANESIKMAADEYNYHTRASIYMCMDRCNDAIADFDKAMSMAQQKEAYYYADRGDARLCLGNYKGAIEDYNQAIQLDPTNASKYKAQKAKAEQEMNKNTAPTITWDYPYNAFTSTTNSQYEVKACIHSVATISDVQLFINGKTFTSRGFGVDDDCTKSVNEKITLVAGKNELEIVVKTGSTTTKSEKRTIEYVAKSSGNYHALLIAVQSYDDFSIRDLEKPISDATQLKQVLTQNYTFNESDVHLLQNPTKQQILDKLIYLQERLGENDNLLIFYSGHGTVANEVGYWLPSDAKKDSRVAWLSNSELRDYVTGMKAKHTLVIADACFSGSILTGGYRDITEFACQELAKLPSCRAMTSGANTVVPDESVFFKYLLQKLKENPESCVTAETLYSKIKPAVIYNSPNNQVPQFGAIPMAGDEGGDFIFKKKQ